MIRTQAARTLASATRAAPVAGRAAAIRARTYVTPPDPTHPTDAPKPTDKPQSNATLYLLAAGTLAAVGGWYAMQGGEDPHQQRVADQERAQRKAQELKDAGVATAHDAVKEGEKGYNDTKAAAKDKLSQARAEAESAAADARSKVDSLKSSAVSTYNDAAHKAEATYNDAKQKASSAVHEAEATTQSWGQWLGSWFGYGKAKTEAKADEAKREGAAKVAEGAAKVEAEAQKRA